MSTISFEPPTPAVYRVLAAQGLESAIVTDDRSPAICQIAGFINDIEDDAFWVVLHPSATLAALRAYALSLGEAWPASHYEIKVCLVSYDGDLILAAARPRSDED